jgi:hypothetical protein
MTNLERFIEEARSLEKPLDKNHPLGDVFLIEHFKEQKRRAHAMLPKAVKIIETFRKHKGHRPGCSAMADSTGHRFGCALDEALAEIEAMLEEDKP